MTSLSSVLPARAAPAGRVIVRHSALVRVCHWVNAICFVVLLMSGMQIFNADPPLTWGQTTNFTRPFFSLSAREDDNGDPTAGVTTIFGHAFNTTGVLGASRGDDGDLEERGFPSWATLPAYQDLAMGRRWHFFFAWILVLNGLLYFVNLLPGRHIRDLWPSLADLRALPHTIVEHLRLRFPSGDEALRYNVLQKLAYLSVVIAFPILILAGLTMSPAIDAAFPWLLDAVPRTAGGARRAFPARGLSCPVPHRPSRDGGALRPRQQPALDDHRPLSHQGGAAMSGELIRPSRPRFTRRRLLIGLGVGAAAAPLSGCDAGSPAALRILEKAEGLTKAAQRALLGPRTALAREFPPGAISPYFKPNGSIDPDDPAYVALRQDGFADWKLEVGGLVERPMKLSLADLRALPSRSQITRHDCVEGWSCIGQWKGAQLSALLQTAGLKPQARYIAFFCADTLEQTLDNTGRYYETIDLIDAFHPQTILAYEMNYAPLKVEHGAPLRLRVERQLGYKMAKYIMRIEAIDGFAKISRGRGGFWEDRGYEWYAGI